MGAAESLEYSYQEERTRILNELARNKEVRIWVENVTLGNNSYTDDLYQELFLHLTELEAERLVDIDTKGYLKFYILRYLTNQYRSDRSPFYKKYKDKRTIHVGIIKGIGFDENKNQPLTDEQIEEQPEYIQLFIGTKKIDFKLAAKQVNKTLQTFDWYERDLFLLKMDSGLSYTDLSKQTHIPRYSIVQTCVTVKNKIKADLALKKLL